MYLPRGGALGIYPGSLSLDACRVIDCFNVLWKWSTE